MSAAKKSQRVKDRHQSGFLVRIPAVYRGKLQELKQKTDKPFTAAVRRALDDYLKANGIDPPNVST